MSQADCPAAGPRGRSDRDAARGRSPERIRCCPPRAPALRSARVGAAGRSPAVNSDRARDDRLAANLRAVRERISGACARASRDPASVTLVAVTKSASTGDAAALARLGVGDLAENRTAALLERRAALEAAGVRVRWHLIGHLQTNKVRRALPAFDVLHSLD